MPDRPLLGGHVLPVDGSSQTPSSSADRARRPGRTRPASARSAVVFPAPFGPSSAEHLAGARPRGRESSGERRQARRPRARCRVIGGSSRCRQPAVAQRDQDATETASSTSLSTIAAVRVGLQREVDRERHGLGAAGEVAGEGDRRAELAERPRPAQHRAGRDRRARPAAASPDGTSSTATRRASPRPPRTGGPRRAARPRPRSRGTAARRTPRPRSRRGVVNGSEIPNQSRRGTGRRRPRRPNASSSATPPTTGGSTSGTVTSARTSRRPRNVARASTQASGTPSTSTAPSPSDAHTQRQPQRLAHVPGRQLVAGASDQGARMSRASQRQQRNGQADAAPGSAGPAARHRRTVAHGRAKPASLEHRSGLRRQHVVDERLRGARRSARR